MDNTGIFGGQHDMHLAHSTMLNNTGLPPHLSGGASSSVNAGASASGLPTLNASMSGLNGGGSGHHNSNNSSHGNSGMNGQMMLLQNFWQSQLSAIEHGELDFKTFQLPLARIKKVMKTDDDVKVKISFI